MLGRLPVEVSKREGEDGRAMDVEVESVFLDLTLLSPMKERERERERVRERRERE